MLCCLFIHFSTRQYSVRLCVASTLKSSHSKLQANRWNDRHTFFRSLSLCMSSFWTFLCLALVETLGSRLNSRFPETFFFKWQISSVLSNFTVHMKIWRQSFKTAESRQRIKKFFRKFRINKTLVKSLWNSEKKRSSASPKRRKRSAIFSCNQCYPHQRCDNCENLLQRRIEERNKNEKSFFLRLCACMCHICERALVHVKWQGVIR